MTAQLAPRSFIAVEEYLEGEKIAGERHEYFDGHVWSMAGASAAHELVAGNVFAALHPHLKGMGCRVDKGDLKLRLFPNKLDLFYYPDVMVTCDPADIHPLYREKPKLLIEVLSEDQNKDLVEKFFAYQHIPSLEEYAVPGQDPAHPRVRIFRPAEGWDVAEIHSDPAAEFTLRSVGLTLTLGELYTS